MSYGPLSPSPIAHRLPLPCCVPPGGVAVVLADGRVASDDVQGPGELRPDRWRKEGRQVEALLFPACAIHLRLDLTGLRTAEDVALDLTLHLDLEIEHPVRFLTDLVRDAPQFTAAGLADHLQDALRTALAPALARRTLDSLYADLRLRDWLDMAVRDALAAIDLPGRSGLKVLAVDAGDLRCTVQDQISQTREQVYLAATVAQAEAAGKRLLDERLLAVLREHLPVKADLVARKEQMADLLEREAAADVRGESVRQARRDRLREWFAAPRSEPSALRPELWRHPLGEKVHTAPLADEERVYIVTAAGRVHAFDHETGAPAWPPQDRHSERSEESRPWRGIPGQKRDASSQKPLLSMTDQGADIMAQQFGDSSDYIQVGTAPGDGLVLANGILWVPGHDGTLYGLDPATGAIVHRIPIGGKLSSAPLAAHGLLYLGVDVAGLGAASSGPLSPGSVAAVDPAAGQVVQHWTVGRYGLRAQPVAWGQMLYVGDRHGAFYALDTRRGRVIWRFSAGGKIASTPALGADMLYFGTLDDGSVYAVRTRDGTLAWKQALGGYVYSSLVLAEDAVYVGCNDGHLYALDARSGDVRWKCPLGGPLASSPAVWEGLVFVGSNDGYVHAVDTATGKEAWRFQAEGAVVASPTVDENGTAYIGADDGVLYALPWHLGKWAWAAAWCEERGWTAEAAAFHALAGDESHDRPARRRHYDAALAVWRASAAPERAARLREAILDPLHEVAAEYEQAAEIIAPRDGARAADLYFRAADCYDEAGQESKAHECRRQATRLVRAPRLQVRPVNLPPFEAGEPGEIVLDVRNYGTVTAQDVRVRLAGQLAKRVNFSLSDITPGQTVELVAEDIMPLDQELRVDLYYRGGQGTALQICQRFTLNVKPLDADIRVGEDVGNVIVRLIEGAPVPKIRIKGSAGLVKVQVEKAETTPQPPSFEWPAPSPGLHTDERGLLVRVALVDELIVPQGHTALLLADERHVGQVGPGRYTRADVPALKKPLVGRAPTWGAVLICTRPFQVGFRLGPYMTTDPVRVGLEFGAVVQVELTRSLDLWLSELSSRSPFTVVDLRDRLQPAIGNVVEVWLGQRALDELQPSYQARTGLLQALELELQGAFERAGLAVIEVTTMNFICPGRAHIDTIREGYAWESLVAQAHRQGHEPSSLSC